MNSLKLPNGYGTVYKLSGDKRRRKPYIVRKTIGWHIDLENGKKVQEYLTIGYAATRAEGLQMLAGYNDNPFDIKASKMTFKEVYEKWSDEKYSNISKSNIHGYLAAYKLCDYLYDKIFKEIKLVDLQHIINTC